MRTFSSLKGLPVYLKNSAKLIGKVSDFYLSKNGKVVGLLIDEKGLLKRNRFLAIDTCLSFGADGIIVNEITILQPVCHDNGGCFFYKHGELAGKMVMTAKGNKLGLLEDVYFQEEMGTIIGYEITDGFFTDISEGKKVITTDQTLQVGKDAIIVD